MQEVETEVTTQLGPADLGPILGKNDSSIGYDQYQISEVDVSQDGQRIWIRYTKFTMEKETVITDDR